MTAEEMFDVRKGELHCLSPYLSARAGEEKARLDGEVTIEELFAIARWMQLQLPPLQPKTETEAGTDPSVSES